VKSTRCLLVLTALLLGLAGRDAWQVLRIHGWNAAIRRGVARAAPAAPAQVRFAAAYASSDADPSAALNAFRALEADPDVSLRRAAKFNGATLYLQQALRGAAAGGAGALAWVELAKQSYRELLREDSGDWDARYNLEQALRIAPDADSAEEVLPPPPDHRHTPSIAPGLSLGLP